MVESSAHRFSPSMSFEHALVETAKKPESNKDLQTVMFLHAEMYRLPDSPPITQKDIQRYTDSRDRFVKPTAEMIEQGLQAKDFYLRLCSVQAIAHVRVSERANLIAQALKDSNLAVRQKTADAIQYAPVGERAQLLKTMLIAEPNDLSPSNMELILGISEKESDELWENVLRNGDYATRVMAAETLSRAPQSVKEKFQNQVKALAKTGLVSGNLKEQLDAVKIMPILFEDSRKDLEELFFQVVNNGLKICEAAVLPLSINSFPFFSKELMFVLQNNLLLLVKDLSSSARWQDRQKALVMSQYLPDTKIYLETVQKSLLDKESPVRQSAAKRIPDMPEIWRTDLLRQALHDDDKEVVIKSFEALPSLPQESIAEFESQLMSTIEEAIRSSDMSTARRLIPLASIKGQGELIKRLREIDWKFLRNAISLAGKTPLYKEEAPFFKKKLSKDGSGTTLLDKVPGDEENTLRERVIIRHIQKGPYLAWRKAYEAVDFWRENGFDYVPIEPIVSVKDLENNLTLNVAARVINGPSANKWAKDLGFFRQNINESIERIKKGLEELGIEHGHAHKDNFVICFPRSKSGQVLIDQPPRVYMIDFDMAVSSE